MAGGRKGDVFWYLSNYFKASAHKSSKEALNFPWPVEHPGSHTARLVDSPSVAPPTSPAPSEFQFSEGTFFGASLHTLKATALPHVLYSVTGVFTAVSPEPRMVPGML